MNQHIYRMHRTQIYLTDTQYNFLLKKAERKETSMANVIRDLIDKILPKEKDFKSNPLFKFNENKFEMGISDGSISHDEYLYRSDK